MAPPGGHFRNVKPFVVTEIIAFDGAERITGRPTTSNAEQNTCKSQNVTRYQCYTIIQENKHVSLMKGSKNTI